MSEIPAGEQVFQRGKPINVVRRFYLVDPLTEVATLTDPGAVTFTIRSPDNVETTYVFGVAPNMTRVSTGVYYITLDPLLPTGDYNYAWVGTTPVVIEAEGGFTVIDSGVLPPDEPTVPVYGPCNSWITGDEVAAYDANLGVGTNTFLLDDVAYMASQLVFEASGRQFPGICQRTVRPCRQGCGCWGDAGGLPWFWGALPSSLFGVGTWGWFNESGRSCGCGAESVIRLAGYPIRQVTEVKIDGAVLATSAYRLDDRRDLVRLADTSTTPPTDLFWPACQDITLPDTEPGTISVSYLWGADPPALGKMAAAELAVELWKAMPSNQGECRLPKRVVQVARQGITMTKIVSTADLLRTGMTGLQLFDSFMAMVNPSGLKRRPLVWSPDQDEYARKVGQ